MKIEILYQATYQYAEPVTFSPHVFRLIPRVDRSVKLRHFDFATNSNAVVYWRRDLFDNEVASVFFPEPSPNLLTQLRLQLEVESKNAFGFLLESRALEMPFSYESRERCILAPYLAGHPAPPLPFWQPPTDRKATVDLLSSLNSALFRNIQYERRQEGHARTTAETLSLGRGACRDIAVVLVDMLRGLGLAARFASGYLCEYGETDKRAEGALHAWVETYLPGAGWIGLDPTNGTFCDHHHLTAAVGADITDVAPIEGSYYHPTSVPHQMMAALEIHFE